MSPPLYDPHRQADGVKRADKGLRSFAKPIVIGGATMCPACDGAGYEIERVYRSATYGWGAKVSEPRKCRTCGGEGLDPTVHGGGE